MTCSASIFAPCGSLLAPFGSFWLPFGYRWTPYWLTLTPLALFGSLLHPALFLISNTFLLRFRYFPKPSAKSSEIDTCTLTSYRFSHTSIFACPERINCRRQPRSAPGLRRMWKRVRIGQQCSLSCTVPFSFSFLLLFFCS